MDFLSETWRETLYIWITGTNLDPLPRFLLPRRTSIGSRLQTVWGSRCGSGAASKQLHRNGKDDGKRQKNFRRDAPQKYTSKGRKEGKSIFNISFQSNINNLCCLCFFYYYYLFTFFSAACLWNFLKDVPSLPLSLFYTRLFDEKQSWHASLTPPEGVNTALIFIYHTLAPAAAMTK